MKKMKMMKWMTMMISTDHICFIAISFNDLVDTKIKNSLLLYCINALM
jgi:hypothetical protein